MAAGRSIGTIFAEIDLSKDPLDRKLDAIKKDAGVVVTDIEKNFQTLGLKSAQHFDLLRAKIENAYQGILHGAKSTENDILRAKEATTRAMAALDAEQNGRALLSLENLKAHYVAASVAIVAAWSAVNKAVAMMDEAGKALAAESAFTIMADQAGVSADRMIASMKDLTQATIDDAAMMQKAVKLMTLGFDPAQIERFSAVVLTAAQIAGTTAAQAFDELGDAIANRTPKALVRLGAVTKEQMELVTKAIEAGADSTVLFDLAMTNLEAKQKMLQGTQNEATLALQRFHTQVNETAEALGKGLIWAVQELYGGLQILAGGFLYAGYSAAKLLEVTSKLVGMSGLSTWARDWADALKLAGDELKAKGLANMFGMGGEETQRASNQEIDAAKAAVQAQQDKLTAIVAAKEAEKQAAKERAEIQKAKEAYDAYDLAFQEEINRLVEQYGKTELANAQKQAEQDAQWQEIGRKGWQEYWTGRAQDELDAATLAAQLKADLEAQQWTAVDEARQKDLQSYFAYIDEMLAKDFEAARAKAAYDDAESAKEIRNRQLVMQSAQETFGNMANASLAFYQATGAKHKELFRLYQAMKISETIISTYSAAMKAYDAMASIPYVGPILGAAAAAAVIAFGMAQVATIAAQKPESSSAGGSGGPATPGGSYAYTPAVDTYANTTQVGPRPQGITVYNYGYIGTDKDTFARDMMDAIRKAQEDRA